MVGLDGTRAEHWVVMHTYLDRQKLYQAEPVPAVDPGTPFHGDLVMKLSPEWLDLILDGAKVLELRGRSKNPGRYWLACGGFVRGVATTLAAIELKTVAEFKKYRHLHRVPGDELPCGTTFALPLKDVARLPVPVPYVHHHGAVGWMKFEAPRAAGAVDGETSVSEEDAEPMADDAVEYFAAAANADMASDAYPFSDAENVWSSPPVGGAATPLAHPPAGVALDGPSDDKDDMEVDDGAEADDEDGIIDYEAALDLFRLEAKPLERRRLTGKQPAPPQWQQRMAGVDKRPAAVLKRPAVAMDEGESPADDEREEEPARKKPAAADECEQPVRKRPASARLPYRNELCRGRDGCPCKFSTAAAELAARVQSASGQVRCMFCDDDLLQRMRGQASGKSITMAMKKLYQNNPTMVQPAVDVLQERFGEEVAAGFETRLGRAAARPKARAKAVAGREPYPSELCAGRGGVPCLFSLDAELTAAQIQPGRGERHCLFCDDDRLQVLNAARNGKIITSALGKLRVNNPEKLEDGLAIIENVLGVDRASYFRQRLERAQQRVRGPRQTLEEEWDEALAHRVSVAPQPTREHRRSFPKWHLDDERLRDKKFCLAFSEDTDPAEWMTPLASSLDRWARFAAWGMCKVCHRLEKRPLQPLDVSRPHARRAYIAKCKFCKDGIGYPAPQLGDIPEPLRKLTVPALEALMPLDIDIGEHHREPFGYRVHTDMTRLFWSEKSVEEKMAALSGRHYDKAVEAWNYLIEHAPEHPPFRSQAAFEQYYMEHPEQSAYKDFTDLHDAFLRRAGCDLSKNGRRRPVRFFETVGIETALFPHLYPKVGMCETYVRRQDERRQARDREQRRQRARARCGDAWAAALRVDNRSGRPMLCQEQSLVGGSRKLES
jgi:hypothetical protein